VSAHGTGGAWLIATDTADHDRLYQAVFNSLDRKVCNTVNTCVVSRAQANTLLPVILDALTAAAKRRNTAPKLHAVGDAGDHVPAGWFNDLVSIVRAEGTFEEPRAQTADTDLLAHEFEWEESPEMSVVLCDDLADGIGLFNRYAPRFVLSVISANDNDHVEAFNTAEAPYVGDGFTRWVDGQYALGVPELGLSNWENGRLLARGGILTGEGITTVRYRVRQHDPGVSR
jgi:glutamate-5-semialdehyde dehydrogenase